MTTVQPRHADALECATCHRWGRPWAMYRIVDRSGRALHWRCAACQARWWAVEQALALRGR